MDCEFVRDAQRFFTYLVELSRAKFSDLNPAAAESKASRKLSVAIQRDGFEVGRPYQAAVQGSAAQLWLDLVMRGQEVYSRHRDLIRAVWTALEQTTNDLDLENGLMAVYAAALVCSLRNIVTIPVFSFYSWILRGRAFWSRLSCCNLARVLSFYQDRSQIIKHILITALLEACECLALSSQLYGSLYHRLTCEPPYSDSLESPEPAPEALVGKMQKMLRIETVKATYKGLFGHIPEVQPFDTVYDEAVSSLAGNVYLVSEMVSEWGVLGVTLPLKVIVLDRTSQPDALLSAYNIYVLSYEFAHYLLRRRSENWHQFFAVVTPLSSTQGSPILPTSEENKEVSRTAPPSILAAPEIELLGRTEGFEEGPRIHYYVENEEHFGASMRALVEDFGQIMPNPVHGEAGIQLEKALYGLPPALYPKGAQVILDWVEKGYPHEDFLLRFQRLNDQVRNSGKTGQRVRTTREPEISNFCVKLDGGCNLTRN